MLILTDLFMSKRYVDHPSGTGRMLLYAADIFPENPSKDPFYRVFREDIHKQDFVKMTVQRKAVICHIHPIFSYNDHKKMKDGNRI